MSVRTRTGHAVPLDRDALALAFPDAQPRLCVFVHGLVSTESIWRFPGRPDRTYGTMLADEYDVSSVYVRYNTGLHISTNGHQLAALMHELVRAWPVRVREIDLVGHSMGGLVIRSACHYGRNAATPFDRLRGRGPWPKKVRRVVLLGVPNSGAKLEVIANQTSATLRSMPSRVTRLIGAGLDRRSDGIKDLRWASLLDEDWIGRDPGRSNRPSTHRCTSRAEQRSSRSQGRSSTTATTTSIRSTGCSATRSCRHRAHTAAATATRSCSRTPPSGCVRRSTTWRSPHRAEVYAEISAWWRATSRPPMREHLADMVRNKLTHS